ncbi:SixA phosphatase family protein [Flavobacterium sp.]|uniref:SixA phosphatase family protein n=1 Tax=Flavobacterium sp. TaxID=239 RepID=UPI0037514F05
MKKIILIRHAKAQQNFSFKDFERPLTDVGIERAIEVAIKSKSYISIDSLIVSSSSVRTSQTARLFVQNWNLSQSDIIYYKELYTFKLSELEKIVKSFPNQYNNIILFGHNYAITDFVNKFGDILIENIPTAGLVSIIFDTNNWKDINKGKTDKIIFPSDI